VKATVAFFVFNLLQRTRSAQQKMAEKVTEQAYFLFRIRKSTVISNRNFLRLNWLLDHLHEGMQNHGGVKNMTSGGVAAFVMNAALCESQWHQHAWSLPENPAINTDHEAVTGRKCPSNPQYNPTGNSNPASAACAQPIVPLSPLHIQYEFDRKPKPSQRGCHCWKPKVLLYLL